MVLGNMGGVFGRLGAVFCFDGLFRTAADPHAWSLACGSGAHPCRLPLDRTLLQNFKLPLGTGFKMLPPRPGVPSQLGPTPASIFMGGELDAARRGSEVGNPVLPSHPLTLLTAAISAPLLASNAADMVRGLV